MDDITIDNNIKFENLILKEQIFIQNYLLNINIAESAFYAGYCDIDKKRNYSDITRDEYNNLSRAGNRVLKKDYIKNIICSKMKEIASENDGADCREVVLFLTDIIRLSKNNLANIKMLNQAIKAAALLLARFPVKPDSENEEIIFCTGIDDKGDIIK